MKAGLLIETRVLDRAGQVISRRERRAKSFVVGMAHHLRMFMSEANVQLKDIDNTNRTIFGAYSTTTVSMACNAALGVITKGLRVGTDSTAPTIENYALLAPIAHGNGAGELEHLASIFDAVSIVGATARFAIRRTFNNNSGAPITVKEWALYCRSFSSAVLSYTFCLIRDADPTGDAIPNGAAYQVAYTLLLAV